MTMMMMMMMTMMTMMVPVSFAPPPQQLLVVHGTAWLDLFLSPNRQCRSTEGKRGSTD